MKILNCGYWKTGTKSLGQVFHILKFRSHYRFLNFNLPLDKMNIKEIHNYHTWAKHYFHLEQIIKSYDFFTDTPFHFIYDRFLELHPDLKVMLSMRDNTDLIAISSFKFALKYYTSKNRIDKINIFKDIPPKEYYINRYLEHNQRVLDFFNKKGIEVLKFNIDKDRWEKICNWLNLEIPNKDFPHVNSINNELYQNLINEYMGY